MILSGFFADIAGDEARLTQNLAARSPAPADMERVIRAYHECSSQNGLFEGFALGDVRLADCPEQSAIAVREAFGANVAKLHDDRQLNILDLIRAIDDVKLIELDMEADGYFMLPGTLGKSGAIYLKSSKALYTRRRFTLAHEMGHFAYRLAKIKTCIDEEAWCDQFAAALLMPAMGVVRHFRAGESIIELRQRYNVSDAAMRRRLVDLLGEEFDAISA